MKTKLQLPPDSVKKHLAVFYIRLTSEASKVLKELANSFKTMRRSSSVDHLLEDMKTTADELQNALSCLPQEATALIVETLPLITVASLLIEISQRVQGVVDAVREITSLPCFKAANCEDIKLQNKVLPTMA